MDSRRTGCLALGDMERAAEVAGHMTARIAVPPGTDTGMGTDMASGKQQGQLQVSVEIP